MNQQFEVKNPIEERNLFTYVFLVPVAMIIITVVMYIFVFAATVGVATDDTYGSGAGAVFGGGAALISIICGVIGLAGLIYFLVIWTGVSRDINTMCQGDAQSSPLIPFAGAWAIVFIPFGCIYYYYYLYKMQDKMSRNAQRYGTSLKWSAIAVLLFGIFIGIVAFALLIISFNQMARAYNESLGYSTPERSEYDNAGDYVAGEIIEPARNMFYDGGNQQGTLVCIAGESAGASIVMNEGDSVVLGRDPQVSNIILRNDKKISRRHCTITYRNGGFSIIDYSTNGTKLENGQKLESGVETPLGRNAVIYLSDQSQFRVQAN